MFLRWTSHDPWREFRALQRQMDQMVRELVPGAGGHGAVAHTGPAFNVSDLGQSYVIEAELPGVTHDDLRVDATASSLTIKGRRDVAPPEGYATHRSERSTLEFSRAFTFDSKLDLENVTAKLNDGMLRIEAAKQAMEQPRTITVKAR
jgi:HSP20 family protein